MTETTDYTAARIETLRYRINAQYSDIIDHAAKPLRYRKLARMVRRLATLQHIRSEEVLADLRDSTTDYWN